MSLKLVKYKKEQWQEVADCIRSDQVPANEIAELFTDKAFYNWYSAKYFTHK